MSRVINELFGPRRTNNFRYAEPRKRINTEILAGWFCCAVFCVAAWSMAFWIVRWAWSHWSTVMKIIGL